MSSNRRLPGRLLAATLALGTLASPALLAEPVRAEDAAVREGADLRTAPEPAYLDDRSDPAAVIRSLYNAVDRHEYVRAYSYFRDEPDRPAYGDFAAGYATTARARVRTGKATSEGAAGSLYFTVPVAVEAWSDGKAALFTGCYTLRLVQPGVQAEPPFHPMGIVKGTLASAEGNFAEAMGACPET